MQPVSILKDVMPVPAGRDQFIPSSLQQFKFPESWSNREFQARLKLAAASPGKWDRSGSRMQCLRLGGVVRRSTDLISERQCNDRAQNEVKQDD